MYHCVKHIFACKFNYGNFTKMCPLPTANCSVATITRNCYVPLIMGVNQLMKLCINSLYFQGFMSLFA